MSQPSKKVVIIGAGFAGLNTAKRLANSKGLSVTLIDRRNHHLFQPLLYQVATAGLSPADIATPVRSLFTHSKNVEVLLGHVESINKEASSVKVDGRELSYDFLVVAGGSRHSYFGHPEWEPFAPGLKSLEEATEIRRRILLAFERAEKEADLKKREALLTFVIIGAGPTGVELAGAIAELSHQTLNEDFRHIDPSKTRVILVEGAARILGAFDESLAQRASRDLENLGVQILVSSLVTDVNASGVALKDHQIAAETIIWAAGVAPSPLAKALEVPLDRQGRVLVETDLSLKNHPSIFVIGDQAAFVGADGKALPGLAPVAIQQGKHVARNIQLSLQRKARENFRYRDKGIMATIGRRKAITQAPGLNLHGFVAWMAWLFVHVFYLIGFKNRVSVFAQWTWSYLTFKRGARLIVDKDWRSTSERP